jgi:uncharacterized membrane protein
LALYFAGHILGAIGLGTLAAALNRLLDGRPRIVWTAVLTALLLLAQFCLADFFLAWRTEMLHSQAHLLTPYFWKLGAARIISGTILGTLCGHWIISKITRAD